MKVFELEFDNEDEPGGEPFTFWLATDRKFSSKEANYTKEIKEYDENTPGIDLIVY